MSTKEFHQEISNTALAKVSHDIILTTDGAGYIDGYSGFGYHIEIPAQKVVFSACGFHSASSVARAEFTALLEGCEKILEIYPYGQEFLRRKPANVYFVSDREDLVLSVARKPNGDTYYGRKASQDLWARFAYYEQFLHFTAVFSPRNTQPNQQLVDHLASEMRILGKDALQYLWLQEQKIKITFGGSLPKPSTQLNKQ